MQISIQYSRFLVSKFYVIFRLRAFFIPTIKLYKHHSLNIPPKSEFFILNLITIWAEHFTFSEALESHQGQFPSTFCPTACFYLCKISFIYWKKKKKKTTVRMVTQWNTLLREVVEYYPGEPALVDLTLRGELRWDDLQSPLPPSSIFWLFEFWLP